MAGSSESGLPQWLKGQWVAETLVQSLSRVVHRRSLEHTLLQENLSMLLAIAGPVLGEPNPWTPNPKWVGKYPGWEQAVHFFNFIFAVERMAYAISVVTMCRDLLGRQPDLFTFCMNERMFGLLIEEVEELWGVTIRRDQLRAKMNTDSAYIFGKPITVIADLPDGVIIGGE